MRGVGLRAESMASCTLTWFADRGFELTLEVTTEEVVLRLDAVPVPADGTIELGEGVELHRLDVLFKASVMIEGEPGQVHEAQVKIAEEGGKPRLLLDTRCEDVETGEILPFKAELSVVLPPDAPASGGPRPKPLDEDELDWDDETTLEALVVSGPDPVPAEEPPEAGSRGLKALLEALANIDDEEEEAPTPAPEEGLNGHAPTMPQGVVEPPRAEGDQWMGAAEEARGLLQLLLQGENLELEEGCSVDALVAGTVAVLALDVGAEAKATKLSGWLLEQDSVADLFIGDEELAAILEQW